MADVSLGNSFVNFKSSKNSNVKNPSTANLSKDTPRDTIHLSFKKEYQKLNEEQKKIYQKLKEVMENKDIDPEKREEALFYACGEDCCHKDNSIQQILKLADTDHTG